MDRNLKVAEEFWQLPGKRMPWNSLVAPTNSKTVDCSRYESDNCSLYSAVKEMNSNDAKSSRNSNKKRAKTYEEIKFLEEMFEKDPTWSRKTVQIWKKALNLKTNQIYKWGYDRKILNKKSSMELGESKSNHEGSKFLKLSEQEHIQNPNELVQCIVSAKPNYFKKTHLDLSGKEAQVRDSDNLNLFASSLLDNTDNISMLSMMNNFCEIDSTKVTLNELSRKITSLDNNVISEKKSNLIIKIPDDLSYIPQYNPEIFTSKYLRTEDNDFNWFTPTSIAHHSVNLCDTNNDIFSHFLS